MSSQIGLTAALIAASAAALVAALLVPWAQGRTRRTEGWEQAVTGLSAMLDVGFDRAIERLRRAMTLEVSLRYAATDADAESGIAQALANAVIDRHAAEDAVDELVSRFARLELVVRLRLPERDRDTCRCLSAGLLRSLTALEAMGWRIDLGGVRSISEPEARIAAGADDARRSREAFADWVRPIALTMKPPRPLRRLLARRVSGWFGWLRRLYDGLHERAVRRLAEGAEPPGR